jgi:hypothetical protein
LLREKKKGDEKKGRGEQRFFFLSSFRYCERKEKENRTEKRERKEKKTRRRKEKEAGNRTTQSKARKNTEAKASIQPAHLTFITIIFTISRESISRR